VLLEDDGQLERFKRWAEIGRANGAQMWMQINHPGRQMAAAMGQETWAPSPVALDMGRYSNRFAVPREMTAGDIAEVTTRFTRTAQLAERAGFDGVEIHAAHGYLLSQFLSPLSNKRTDAWGGSPENRARLLIEIVKNVRNAVSRRFAVAVKLNSADFQRGGFGPEDAGRVVQMLNGMAVDVVELSGGSYEAPAMQGQAGDGHKLSREAYFLEFARKISAVARMPLMLTGGIRRRSVAEQVIDSGVSIAGIATALAINPSLPREWRTGKDSAPALRPVNWKSKPIKSLANMAMVKYQLRRLSQGRSPDPRVCPARALILQQLATSRQTRAYRRWMSARPRKAHDRSMPGAAIFSGRGSRSESR
jgi:2,4-dienoyl-CoA reductase-like NADH-dependent reductase (Old Yellow Enzyme family)